MMREWRRTGRLRPVHILWLAAAQALWMAWAVGPAFPQAAPAEPKLVIKRIDVEGNQRVSASAVRATIRLKEGDPYEAKAVDDDVSRLWTLGAFEDIKVERQPFEGGVRLVFTVKERPTIGKIIFAGNKALADSKLREALDFKEKDYLNRYLAQTGRDKLAEKYHDEGYQFAEIALKIDEAARPITVTYTLREGPRVRIRAINFTGNTAYSAAKLRSLMQTSVYRWILNPGVYKDDVLRNDLFTLKDFYRSNGWLDVVVARELTYSDDKASLTVTLHIQEGERYKIEGVVITGNDLFTGAEIRKKLVLKEGSYFVSDDMRKDQGAIQDMYGEQGYIDAQVKPRTSLSEAGAQLKVRYDIEEKRRVYVERVQIRGNEKTQDHVIRREITLNPGERFNTLKIKDSQNRLRNTGLFQSFDPKGGVVPIKFDTEPGTEPDRRDLVVDVTEGKTGELNMGVGVSSNTGLVGEFSITQENFDITDFPKSWSDFVSGNSFVGGGQVLTLRARPGTERQDYLLSFRDPSVFDSPYGYGMSAFYSQRVRDYWDEDRFGGTISVDRAFWKNWRAGVSWIPENVQVTNLSSEVTDPAGPVTDVIAAQGWHSDTSVKFDLIRDTRDNRFLASDGSRVEGSIQIFSQALGGNYDFAKFEVEAKKYFTLFTVPNWGKHILSLGGDFGVEAPFGSTTSAPVFDRFFAGGPGDAASLRGFRFRGIGPVQGARHVQVGGDVMLLGTVAYEFPIVQDTIRGVVFGDAGKVASDFDTFDQEKVRASAGVGLRLRFPFFGGIPIALDWGVPVSQQQYDRTQVFSFTIGTGVRF